MKFKKIWTYLLTCLLILTSSNYILANDNFIDNNANKLILEKNPDAKIIVSEFNTGKIISKTKENDVVPYRNLSSKIAVFLLSEELKNKTISLDTSIELLGEDETLAKFKIKDSITVKDALFLLEQQPSNILINSVFKKLNKTISDAQLALDKLTLRQTELNSLELTDENKTTARNLNYLIETTVKNYPELTELTKNPTYELINEESIDNNLEFIESDSIRSIGLDYTNNSLTAITYSGNTKIVITILNSSQEKTPFFDSVQDLYEYIFANYQYKLALKAGTYDINNENITIEEDIYDLFFREHSEKDIKYFLMNEKILFLQNYNYISGNSGTVFANYTLNNKKTTVGKIKETFIQDSKFNERTNRDKFDIIVDRTQYFVSFVLLIYSAIFLILFILQKPFKKGE